LKNCLQSSWGTNVDVVTNCLERLGDVTKWEATQWSASWATVFFGHALKCKQKLETYRALQFLGDVFLAQDDLDTATVLFNVALEGFNQMDVHRSKAECMLRLGDISKLQAELPKALELWDAARPLFERSSQARQIVHVDERLASIRGLL
jgi:hypothetical protein